MVNSWIEWTRENVNTKGGYPKITSVAITGQPWKDKPRDLGKFTDEPFRHDRLAAFTDALAPDPAEFATRFTALHYYYTLLSRADVERANPELFEWDDESELESLIKAFNEDLALLVRFLPLEQCPADWRFVHWEILNSYLIRDYWDRALKLYNRAEELELLERSELQALRGQFRFLTVYFSAIAPREEDGLDSLQWEPVIYGHLPEKPDRDVVEALSDFLQGQRDKSNALAPYRHEELIRVFYQLINEIRLFGFGMSTTETDLKLKDREQEWLRAASVELENALEKRTDLPSRYRSILARSYFLTGHFHDSARQYERLVQTNPSVGAYESLRWSPGVRQPVKTQVAVG